jgi:serine protease inhibitor
MYNSFQCHKQSDQAQDIVIVELVFDNRRLSLFFNLPKLNEIKTYCMLSISRPPLN